MTFINFLLINFSMYKKNKWVAPNVEGVPYVGDHSWLIVSDRIWQGDELFSFAEEKEFSAIGSGAKVAVGAYRALKQFKNNPELILGKILDIVTNYNLYCKGSWTMRLR